MKKVLTIIFSLFLIALVGFGISWAVINFNQVKEGMTGTQIYTNDDLQNAYQDGYNTALKNKDEYDELINSYRDTIITLNDNISQLNSQNRDCQNLIARLQESGLQDEQTIATLQAIISGNNDQITSLSEEIKALNKSIAYYQQLVANLDLDGQVVVTFEYDGSVCNFQILDKNSLVTVNEPESTIYKTFNGWTVDGQLVDLTTYRVTKNTRFIADVIYRHDVNFIVDGVSIAHQVLAKNEFVTLPAEPSKDGYEFDGWTIDGVNPVEVNQIVITGNTNLFAVFTKLHCVSFEQAGEIIATVLVRNNEYAIAPDLTLESNIVFNGWLVNGELVAIDNYPIQSNITFVASLTKKEKYFEPVEFKVVSDKNLSGANIWSDGENLYYSSSKTQYVYNRSTREWETKTWNGNFTQFSASYIWTDGVNIYYSTYLKQYVLNKANSSWEEKVWGGMSYPNKSEIWTDGTDIYLSLMNPNRNFILNRQNSTWIEISWQGVYHDYFHGSRIWSDGINTYFSLRDEYQYVLKKGTDTWENKTWNGFVPQATSYIWSDGENIYYSDVANNQFYVLDVATSTWLPKEWNVYLDPKYFWWDGSTMYYSSGKTHYVLVKP